MWKRVLLPQPLGPRMATSSPGSATRSTPSRATTGSPSAPSNVLPRPRTSSRAPVLTRGPRASAGGRHGIASRSTSVDEAEQEQRQRGRHQHGAEDEIGAEGVLGRRHVDAEPLLGADELRDRGGHVGVRHGDLEAGEELRQRARQPHAPEQLPLGRAHGAQQADGVAVGRREALHEADGDGEEGEEGDEADLRALAEAEPDDHERREGDDRQRLRGDDQRVDASAARRARRRSAMASTKATTMATARPRIASRVVVTMAGQRLERSSQVDSSTSRGAGSTVSEVSSSAHRDVPDHDEQHDHERRAATACGAGKRFAYDGA